MQNNYYPKVEWSGELSDFLQDHAVAIVIVTHVIRNQV